MQLVFANVSRPSVWTDYLEDWSTNMKLAKKKKRINYYLAIGKNHTGNGFEERWGGNGCGKCVAIPMSRASCVPFCFLFKQKNSVTWLLYGKQTRRKPIVNNNNNNNKTSAPLKNVPSHYHHLIKIICVTDCYGSIKRKINNETIQLGGQRKNKQRKKKKLNYWRAALVSISIIPSSNNWLL